MSDTNARETLLRRWSEWAPEECEIWSPVPAYDYWEFRMLSKGWIITTDDDDAPRLLAAVIDAIRARGWHYVLESYTAVTDPKIQAKATMVVDNRGSRIWKYAVEPCDALLATYIAVLEVVSKGARQ